MASTDSRTLAQAAAIPYRWRGEKLEFCLITTSQKGNWTFPKGIIDPGETDRDAALKEAHEEAGLSGEIQGQQLGRFSYAKWGKELEVTVWLMQVTDVADEWDECHLRNRRWVSAKAAAKLISRDELRELLAVAVKRVTSDRA